MPRAKSYAEMSDEEREHVRAGQRRRHIKYAAEKRLKRTMDRVARVEARPKIGSLDCAWAAGLFEGEGTVTLSANKAMRVRPSISVPNTDREVVEFFHRRWGGSIRNHQPSGNARLVHVWGLSSGEPIECFIRDMLPFIRTRRVRDKMEIVLQDVVDRFANVQRGKVYERSLDRMATIRELNRRGKPMRPLLMPPGEH